MDFASAFFADLIEFAKSPDFKGEQSVIAGQEAGVLNLYKVRWQDDQGIPKWEALLPAFLPEGGEKAIAYPDFFRQVMLEVPGSEALPILRQPAATAKVQQLLGECADAELESRCTPLRHPNDIVLLASATIITP